MLYRRELIFKCIFIFILFCSLNSFSQKIGWIHTYDSPRSQVNRVIYDGNENLYMAGYLLADGNPFDGITLKYPGGFGLFGYEDGMVCKSDTEGHLIWVTLI